MLFIAEIGMNYNGNFDLAYELIKQAKNSGADIAKFQLGWRDGEDDINYIDKNRLNILKKWCDYFEIEFMVSVITEKAFELSNTLDFNIYKIASRTVKDNLPLVKKIVAEGKTTFISLSIASNACILALLYCSSKLVTLIITYIIELFFIY